MPFRTLCFIEYQGPCSIDLNLGQSDNCISESTVHRLSDDALFVHHETSLDILKSSDIKAFVAETSIWASMKIVFLESTVHKISVDALFGHN
jgi:hypothetical protein